MTTLELEIELMRYLDHRRNLIVTELSDFSGLTYFETDMLSLTKSGYATAIELKVTKADLKNDLKKKHIHRLQTIRREETLKHLYKNIKYFYYTVPEQLAEEALQQIPEIAGLYVASKRPHPWYPEHSITEIKEVKKPTIINPVKWTDKMRMDLARLGAMRIYTLKKRLYNTSTEVYETQNL